VDLKILLDTNAYVGFKRNVVEIVDFIVSAESIMFSPNEMILAGVQIM